MAYVDKGKKIFSKGEDEDLHPPFRYFDRCH